MRVIELRDDHHGLEAFVVVDHDQFPIAAGGTRMLPDVNVAEVARLARAMTWKFAVWRVPYAGAKAGVRFSGGAREDVMAAYRRALEPYSDVFRTGPDMGTSPADFTHALEGPPPLWAQSYEGVDMDDLATGHGVKAAAAAALAHRGRALDGAAIAIEGFGKVGAGMALASARAGARIVGVSTVDGLLADPGGLAATGAVWRSASCSPCASATATRSSPTARPPSARAGSCSASTATYSCPARGRTRSRATSPRACAARASRRPRTSPTAPARWRSSIAAGSRPSPTSSPTPAASTS